MTWPSMRVISTTILRNLWPWSRPTGRAEFIKSNAPESLPLGSHTVVACVGGRLVRAYEVFRAPVTGIAPFTLADVGAGGIGPVPGVPGAVVLGAATLTAPRAATT